MKKIIYGFSLVMAILLLNINAQAQHRKISPQAKGAIIGGVGGAVVGGLVGHNATGAIVGGAVGAGGGYVIGNEHRRNVERRRAAYRSGYHHGYTRASYHRRRHRVYN